MQHAAARNPLHAGTRAARPAAGWLRLLARVGLAAKGVVYVLVGLLAAQAALGGGAPEGSEGALRTVELQPFGQILLAAIAAGLAAYVLWRLAAAIFNPDDDGPATRAALVARAVVYAGLAVEAFRMAVGGGGGGGSGDERAAHWTARVLALSLGGWLVAGAGIGTAGYGLHQLYRAWAADLADDLDLARLRRSSRRAVLAIGRTGIAARGIVFLLIGWFLLNAGLRADAAQARGLEGALRAVQSEAYGPFLLAAVAAGLIAYGLYQLVRARYRRVGA